MENEVIASVYLLAGTAMTKEIPGMEQDEVLDTVILAARVYVEREKLRIYKEELAQIKRAANAVRRVNNNLTRSK